MPSSLSSQPVNGGKISRTSSALSPIISCAFWLKRFNLSSSFFRLSSMDVFPDAVSYIDHFCKSKRSSSLKIVPDVKSMNCGNKCASNHCSSSKLIPMTSHVIVPLFRPFLFSFEVKPNLMSACEGAVKLINRMNNFNSKQDDFIISYLVPLLHHIFSGHLLSQTEPFVLHVSKLRHSFRPMPKIVHEMPSKFPLSQLLPFDIFALKWKLENKKNGKHPYQ